MKTLEEHKQAIDIEEITKQVKRRQIKKFSDGTKEKPSWLGTCFFDDYDNAWLYIDGDNYCIGKEKDIREACKLYNTDVENPSDIKNAIIRWRRENVTDNKPNNSLISSPEPQIKASTILTATKPTITKRQIQKQVKQPTNALISLRNEAGGGSKRKPIIPCKFENPEGAGRCKKNLHQVPLRCESNGKRCRFYQCKEKQLVLV